MGGARANGPPTPIGQQRTVLDAAALAERFFELAVAPRSPFANARPKRFEGPIVLYHGELEDPLRLRAFGQALERLSAVTGRPLRYGADPNLLVHFVEEDTIAEIDRAYLGHRDPTVRAAYQRARRSDAFLEAGCFFVVEIDANFTSILHAHLFAATALPRPVFAACLEEELLQAAGLFGDAAWPESGLDDRISPPSALDELLLAVLYDPEMRLAAPIETQRARVIAALCRLAPAREIAIGGCPALDAAP